MQAHCCHAAPRRAGQCISSARRHAACMAAHPPHEAPTTSSRRQLVAAMPATGMLLLLGAQPALATNPVADFLRSRQAQNGGAKLLAPLRAAQARLQEADAMLSGDGGADSAARKQALQTVRASSLNCYVYDALEDDSIETRASLFTQRFVSSADPCTFRIILKSVTSLRGPDAQQQAAKLMDTLLGQYQALDASLAQARAGDAASLPAARRQLQATQVAVADVEAFVTGMLGV